MHLCVCLCDSYQKKQITTAFSVDDRLVWMISCVMKAHLIETDLPVVGGGQM